jgi:hypothetical protein
MEDVMTAGPAAGEKIAQRLQESLQRLRNDLDRVEIWAGALEGFTQPVPEYKPRAEHVLPADKRDRK